jgi:COP9 signalosome complex subunit 7
MDLGAGFLAKLEPFLLMSKSAKGAAAAKLILDATGSPGVFVFGELLDVPSIQEVRARSCELEGLTAQCIQLSRNEQYSGHHRLLQLFAYGTYEDYLSASALSYHHIHI